MYGLTRGTVTLIGAAVAGLLIWLATQINDRSTGGYWAVYGVIAAAGLTMAFAQLLGGWTKWGWPRLSVNVLLLGFLPALIAGGWVVAAGQPGHSWLSDHVRNWSNDIGVDGFVAHLQLAWQALAFGVGLVLGFVFDTTGPRTEPVRWRRRGRPVPAAAAVEAQRARYARESGDGR